MRFLGAAYDSGDGDEHDSFQFSLWDSKCDGCKTRPEFLITFNSLYEIHGLVRQGDRDSVGAFNSLYEIPKFLGKYDRFVELKTFNSLYEILYQMSDNFWILLDPSFNSLYEIRDAFMRKGVLSKAFITFNSLYEILNFFRDKSSIVISTFNSLYEILRKSRGIAEKVRGFQFSLWDSNNPTNATRPSDI